jgi:hypothetical protein
LANFLRGFFVFTAPLPSACFSRVLRGFLAFVVAGSASVVTVSAGEAATIAGTTVTVSGST